MARFSLTDFIPSYPDYVKNPNPLFNVYEEEMYQVLQRKQEFKELVLDKIDLPIPGLMKHQKFVERFLSEHTPYTGLLVWHEVGTGKSITSIAVAESLKSSFKRALVLVKGQTVAQNFREQIQLIAPEYTKDEDERPLTMKQINKKIAVSYSIQTFRKFCNMIGPQLYSRNPEVLKRIKEEYSNRVIIIDEVHNLRSEAEGVAPERPDKFELYQTFHTLLHLVTNCKIILLTATPMKNEPREFADIMNLILPITSQFISSTFEDDYFENKMFRPDKRDELMSRIKGYISYLRQTHDDSILRVENAGEKVPGIEGFNIVPLFMEEAQSRAYKKAWDIDLQQSSDSGERVRVIDSGIYEKSRQAILCTFPPTKVGVQYGKIGSQEIDDEKIFNEIARSIVEERESRADRTKERKLERLKKYSVKYHYIVSKALEQRSRKQFIYCRFIEGSGLFLLRSILTQFEYENFPIYLSKYESPFGNIPKKNRYALITSNTPQAVVGLLLYAFNHYENRHGEYIQLLLGSSTMGESRSLKCVRDIMILTPHWHYTDTEQAIGRVVRYKSHVDLNPYERTVTIHRLMALPQAETLFSDTTESIDRHMYQVSYQKDLHIKQMEDIAREIAVDCTNNKARNKREGYDDQRECFYKKCEYQCYQEIDTKELISYKDIDSAA